MSRHITETLRDLREQFNAELPQRIQAIRDQYRLCAPPKWRANETRQLRRLLHSLIGAAETFGMSSLSGIAYNLEDRLTTWLQSNEVPDGETWQSIGSFIDCMQQIAREQTSDATLPPTLSISVACRNDSPLIHLITGDSEFKYTLINDIEATGFRPHPFAEPGQFRLSLAHSSSELPAVVILDSRECNDQNELALAIVKLGLDQNANIPLIVIGRHDDLSHRLQAMRAGASHYLARPQVEDRLPGILETLTARKPQVPYRVLLLHHDPVLLAVHATTLRAAGMQVRTSNAPLEILTLIDQISPEVLILDVFMPNADGQELTALLREHENAPYLPVLFLTADTEMTRRVLASNPGHDAFLAEPVQADSLIREATRWARWKRQKNTLRRELASSRYELEREHTAINEHAIVSVTDRAGHITYANDKFCHISGYVREELLGRTHRIVKSDEHPPEFFKKLWQVIISGQIWQGEICNRRKDGRLYWVKTTITPFFDDRGKPYQFVSIRTDITEVKEAEQRLRLLQRAVAASNNGITIADVQQKDMPLIYVNPSFERITGFSREEAVGRNCRFLQGGDRDQPGLTELRAAIAAGKGTRALLRNYRKNGELFWNQLHIAPVHDERGQVTHFIGITEDVSERLRALNALQASEDRLRRGQLYANIGTWEWNVKTGELYWSESIGPLFGYPEGELKTSYANFLRAIHPHDRPAVIAAIDRSLNNDEPYDVEHRVVWPDGTVRWLSERGNVKRDANGNSLQMLGVVQDIDDRKRTELTLAAREKNLQIFKHIIASVVDGVVTIDKQGVIRSFNPAASAMFRYLEAEVVGRKVNILMPEPYRSEHDGYLQDYLNEGEGKIIARQLELTGLRSDGSVFPLEIAVSEIHLQDDLLFVGVMRDISARKQAEQALIDARDAANRANEAKSDFLSSMSHELRTPLNAIIGFGQLLEIDDRLDDDHKEDVQEILKAGHHLLELINEILDLAKLESGRLSLSSEPVELGPVIEECIGLTRTLADKRLIRLRHKKLAGSMVRADRTRLKQALLNLISNAIKYNREGGDVTITERQVADSILGIDVDDTGHGIPPERLPELFKPFHRLEAENSAIEGTGIGLTITRRIVEMMEGDVKVESEVGVGSRFSIELPAVSQTESHRLFERPSVRAITAQNDAGAEAKHNLLLYIEDNPSNLRLVSQIIERRPHIHLLTAHTAELGIELARSRDPQLILLDINMPVMDGYQVLRVLKNAPDTRHIPVIAITANAMPRDIARGKEAGFADYLTKPLDIRHFNAVIDHFLKRAAAEKE
ncbi:PAS domain S-box protein [Methylomarinum vadi]|uniref:PAS domain S-box protein n=1 Tax=Methylomarinum vadi TaxID=438855 RepID=UPI00068F3C89|nr:PAS domain S-box protein [Methylomarinum vadi]